MGYIAKVRNKIIAATYFYRGTNFASKEAIKRGFHLGNGHFGEGMYLSPEDEVAISYIDPNATNPFLTTYTVAGKILTIKNPTQDSGIWDSRNNIDFSKLKVPNNMKNIILKDQKDLGQTILKNGYDAVLLIGEFVDGGDQLLIPKGSKMKLRVVDIEMIKN